MLFLHHHTTVKIAGVIGLCLLIGMVLPACESPDPTGPAATSRVTLTTTRSELPADGASAAVITAYVLNRNGYPADGPIYWSTTCGTLDIATGTLSGGYADVVLTAPNYPCTAVVTADAVHAQKSIEITIGGFSIDLSANPHHIPADGVSQSRLLAYVSDTAGYPVEDGAKVSFSTTAGYLSADSATTSGGWASCMLTSSTTVTTAVIQASVYTTVATAYVNFTSTKAESVTLSASPNSGIPANGASHSVLQAVVTGGYGIPVQGAEVHFTTTTGSLQPKKSVTDRNGIATSYLIAPYSVSDTQAKVQANCDTVRSNEVTVKFNGFQGTPEPSPTPLPTFTPTPQHTNTPTPTFTPVPQHTNTPIPTHTPTETPSP